MVVYIRRVRTIFTLKIIVSIFVKLFLILVLHLPQFFIVKIFGTGDCSGNTGINSHHTAHLNIPINNIH